MIEEIKSSFLGRLFTRVSGKLAEYFYNREPRREIESIKESITDSRNVKYSIFQRLHCPT